MKTIQVEVEDSVLEEVERATEALEMTREAFVRTALERALRQREIIALERRHARGYEERPQTAEEVGEWEAEQVWGEP
ncbi:MAG: ribbon-helix-helix protein, CopG family [Acidobacteria bacterium]|nr:ribbon-helix-helix protein, CopG family [Acidobacteriota bacterium]MBV9923649.1 ribbon-helix-helix protein, CopG family [Acidobacteriota bacterium]